MAYNPFRDGKQTQSTQTGRVNPFRQTSADRSDRERVMRNWQSDAEQHGILNNPQYTDEGKAYQQMAQEYAKYGTQYQNQLKQGVTGRQWAADTARRLEELTQQQRAAQQTERRRQDADAIGDPGLWVTTTEQYDALPEARRQEETRRAKQRPAVSLADYDKRIAELRKEKEWADYFAEAGLSDEAGYKAGSARGKATYESADAATARKRISELEQRLVALNQNSGWASTVEQSDEIERERNAIQQELESLGAGYKNAQLADYTMSWRNGVRDNWTDEERSNFYYLYNDNKDEAQAYARRINDRYAYSDARAKKEKVGEWASQNFWTGLAGTAASVGMTMTSLADTLDRTKEYAATGDVSAKSGLTPADIGMAMTSAIASSLNEKSGTINDNVWVIGGKGLGDLYETGVSILNSLASVYMLGGVGTYANFFGQASKTAYEEGIQRGLSVDKALTYGYASGVAEVAGEMFSIEHLIKMKNPSSLKGIIKNIFVQGGIEASEESATTLMNTISDAIINGDKSELASNYYALIQAGYSPADAEKLVIADWTQGVMYDALGGFVSGVASAGVHSTVQGSMTYKGDAQELIDYAKSEGADTAAGKRAQKYEKRVQSGKRMTNYQAGTLTELAQEAVVSKDLDNIREAVGKRLAALGENSSALTEAVVRQAVQQEAKATDISVPKVTEKQRGLIQNSKAAKRVLSEMDIGNMRMETAAELSGHDGSQYQRSNEWARDIGTRIIAPSEYGIRSTNTVTAEEKRADVKVGDESGKVVGFKNGMARVEVTENGKSTIREVKPDDVQQLPKQTRRLFDEISRYDGDTQAAMYAAYMPGQDIEAYVQAADTAMNLYGAQTKATLEQARSFGKATFRMLSDAQLDALMQAGRKLADQRKAAAERTGESKGEVKQGKVSYDGGEADGRKLKAPSKEAIDRMSDAEKTLAEALTATGVNVVFYESEANAEGKYSGAQGMYYNGTVYLDVNAGMNSVESGQRTIVLTAAHEMTHFIRENSEAGYIALREFITDRLMQQGLDIEELVTQKRARESRELSYDEAVEEVIADACETVLTEPTAIRQLASDNMPLAKKIRKWLNDFFRKIKSAFAGLEAVHDEAKAMTEYMDELRAMWDDALSEAVRNRANKNAAENSDGKTAYSYRGVNDDGIEVYETSAETKKLPYSERVKRYAEIMRNEYRGRTAKFMRNGHAYYALFSAADVRKDAYGDKRSDRRGQRAKIGIGADGNIFELVENATYIGSRAEEGKNAYAHKNVKYWDYFVKQVQIDGRRYDVLANVRKRSDNSYVYSIQVNESKKAPAATQELLSVSERSQSSAAGVMAERRGKSRTPLSPDSIRTNGENVNTKSEKNSARDLTGKYPQLNLNEDISELDGVPAIELTDGSVLPITERDGRYPTHVSFIEANRIDVDDLKSGGWIGNGVYDPSFTSDTQRYIEQQQARKRVAELTGKQYEQFRYSMRDDAMTDRELLARALDSVAATESERKLLAQYRTEFDRYQELYDKLDDAQIEYSAARRAVDDAYAQAKRSKLTAEERRRTESAWRERIGALKATQQETREARDKLLKEVDAQDRKLLKLRAMNPVKDMLSRARADMRETIKARQSKTDTRAKVRDMAKKLSDLLLKESKEKHVLLELQKPVAEVLDMLNLDTVNAAERVAKYDAAIAKTTDPEIKRELAETRDRIQAQGDRLKTRLDALHTAYQAIANSADPTVANGYDENIAAKMQEVSQLVGDTPLVKMTQEQLDAVHDLLKMTYTVVSKANKAFVLNQKAGIEERAQAEIDRLSATEGADLGLKPVQFVKRQFWSMLKPGEIFHKVGGELEQAYNEVRKGEDVRARDVVTARSFFLQAAEKHGYFSWALEEKHDFVSAQGRPFSLSLDDMMSVYATSRREQGKKHLEAGGIVFGKNGKIKVKKKGVTLTMSQIKARAYTLDEQVLDEIIGKLTPEQKAFVEEMENWLSTKPAEWGNEVSRELYGINLFKEKVYWPIKSASEYLQSRSGDSDNVKIKNSGFTRSTVEKANNPIYIGGFVDTWSQHVY